MNVDALVVGSISRDRDPGLDRKRDPTLARGSDPASDPAPRWGGVPVYAGITLARCGLSVGVLSNVAAHDLAPAKKMLNSHGVEVSLGASETTTEFVNLYVNDDDRRQSMVAAARPISMADFPDPMPSPKLIILGPVHAQDIEPAVYAAAFASQAAVALDVQGLVRPSALGPIVERVTSTVLQLATRCRFLKLSEHEFDIVADHYAASAPELARRWNVEEMLITMGAKGGVVVSGETTLTYAPAGTPQARFPTGAGDVMFSSYVALRVFEGLGIAEAAQAAALVAGRQVAGEHIDPEGLIIGAQ